jgi:hypothetical protein
MIGPERHLPVMSLSIFFNLFRFNPWLITQESWLSERITLDRDNIGQREFLNTSLLQLSFWIVYFEGFIFKLTTPLPLWRDLQNPRTFCFMMEENT